MKSGRRMSGLGGGNTVSMCPTTSCQKACRNALPDAQLQLPKARAAQDSFIAPRGQPELPEALRGESRRVTNRASGRLPWDSGRKATASLGMPPII